MKTEEEKAKMLYEAAKAEQVTLLEALEEARSFVSRHSEPWYYSGQKLLGKIDGAIERAAPSPSASSVPVVMSVLTFRMISALRRMPEWKHLADEALQYLTEIGINKKYTLTASDAAPPANPAPSVLTAFPMPDLPDFPPQDYYASDKAFWDATSMRKFAHAYAALLQANGATK